MSNCISPLDDRYFSQVGKIADYLSEGALVLYRTKVELLYLLELLTFFRPKLLNIEKREKVISIYSQLNQDSVNRVKEIEKVTNHDVKAVEYFLTEEFKKNDLEEFIPYIHFGLTSEDVNNLSYALMIKDCSHDVILPAIKDIMYQLINMTSDYCDLPMLARTHGQPASPTTLGKELGVFLYRITKEFETLTHIKLRGKLNGATGNYNAFVFADNKKDWLNFSKDFIENKLKLEFNPLTTQIESKDSLASLFDSVSRVNNIILDMNTDIWEYISKGYFIYEKNKNEVGSSTMPHKVNPIDFENSEGNLEFSNSNLNFMKNKLTKSRLQRDLSDSTVLRNVGVIFAHCLLGYKSALKGLKKLHPNNDFLKADLEKYPEIISEGIQTILRAEGLENSYEIMKDMTRGEKVTLEQLKENILKITENKISKDSVEKISQLGTSDYIGISPQLALWASSYSEEFLQKLDVIS
jgi:adenylosuccinate lyase